MSTPSPSQPPSEWHLRSESITPEDRLRASLLGLCVGDAYGAHYEFRSAFDVSDLPARYGRGVFGTPPGAPTDDSELALRLAEMLTRTRGTYGKREWRQELARWVSTNPPDVGSQTSAAARLGRVFPRGDMPLNQHALGNGSMMCVAPLILAASSRGVKSAEYYAAQHAYATHPSHRAARANRTYARALLAGWGTVSPDRLAEVVRRGAAVRADGSIGHCELALSSVWWAEHDVRHGASPWEALRRVVASGGDTDTNAAIVGAYLGYRYGVSWIEGWALKELVSYDRAQAAADGLLGVIADDSLRLVS